MRNKIIGSIFMVFIVILLGVLCKNDIDSCKKERDEAIARLEMTVEGDYVKRMTFGGHKYIEFFGGNSAWGTHDPSCPCRSKEKE